MLKKFISHPVTLFLNGLLFAFLMLIFAKFISIVTGFFFITSDYIGYTMAISLAFSFGMLNAYTRFSVFFSSLILIFIYVMLTIPFDYFILIPFPTAYLGKILFHKMVYPTGFTSNVTTINFDNKVQASLSNSLLFWMQVIFFVSVSYMLFPLFPKDDPCKYECLISKSQAQAITKEITIMISGAYQACLTEHTAKKLVISAQDIMNYVKLDLIKQYQAKAKLLPTPTLLDKIRLQVRKLQPQFSSTKHQSNNGGQQLQKCSKQLPCFLLRSGGVVQYDPKQQMDRSIKNSAIFFNFDPNGQGNLGSVTYYLYSNGRLTTSDHIQQSNTIISNTALKPQTRDPGYVQF